MKVYDILYGKYLDDDLSVTIGGVQTYITDLSGVISENGDKVRIVQFAEKNFEHKLCENITVVGFEIPKCNSQKRFQLLYNKSQETKNEDTVTVFATDNIVPKKVCGENIAIQHGICWDIPKKGDKTLLRQFVSRTLSAFKTVKRLENVDRLVCVDYNFLNWYRTQVHSIKNKILVVPNYTKIPVSFKKPEDEINIIFARRLFDYRGTRVFVKAIKNILNENIPNLSVTVAGTGPDEEFMKNELAYFKNVNFIKYKSDESLDIHKDKHIAVVPTVGSEGTSLSLLEAMASGCSVVCTNVGGMTNIVIDGYNGLMVDAGDERELEKAIRTLVADEKLRKQLSVRAYDTAKEAFSHQKWEEKWLNILR